MLTKQLNKLMMSSFVHAGRPMMKMNLQFFAEGGDGGSGEGGSDDGADGDGGEGAKPITFTSQADLDSWYDKKMAKSLETAKANWAKESQKAIEEAKTEAERLAAMSAEEKAAAEKEKEEKALAQREAEITRRELRATALETLAEKELPKELIETIVLTDSDACKASIDSVEKAFRAAVEIAVNKRLASSADIPAGNGGAGGKSSPAEMAAKMANSRTESKSSLWDRK